MKSILNALIISLLGFLGTVQGAVVADNISMVPGVINYQGRLVTPANVPYTNFPHKISISLWTAPSGGSKLWTEYYVVQTRDGYFSVNLGAGGTNAIPLWKVLWSYSGFESNDFFMSLTVMTSPDGVDLPTAVESSPRQQFLTSPFSLRAHQSVYARKADALFEAGLGVQAPSVSTTNAQLSLSAATEVSVTSDLRVPTSKTLYARTIQPHSSSKQLSIGTAGTTGLAVGTLFSDTEPGSSTSIRGKTVTLATTNISVIDDLGAAKPMMVRKTIVVTASTSADYTRVTVADHIDTALYDPCVIGWHWTQDTPVMKGIYLSGSTYIYIYFASTPTSGSVTLNLLGIAKAATGAW